MIKDIQHMDERSLELDSRYMSIKEKMTRVEIHNQALAMLRESGLEKKYILNQVQIHEAAVNALQDEIAVMKLAQINDFLRLKDPDIIDILKMRYFNYLSWDEIARKHGRTVRWAQMLRNRGLHQIVEAKEDTSFS